MRRSPARRRSGAARCSRWSRRRSRIEARVSAGARRQYGQLVKKWVCLARNRDAHRYATPSLRCTRAAYICEATRIIEAVRQLLGHASLGLTSACLNIDKKRALDIARRYEL